MSKKATLRRIDQGTRYDVTGLLRKWTRRIERDELGEVTDVMLIIRTRNGQIASTHLGPGDRERAHYMASTMKNRLEPA